MKCEIHKRTNLVRNDHICCNCCCGGCSQRELYDCPKCDYEKRVARAREYKRKGVAWFLHTPFEEQPSFERVEDTEVLNGRIVVRGGAIVHMPPGTVVSLMPCRKRPRSVGFYRIDTKTGYLVRSREPTRFISLPQRPFTIRGFV